MSSSSSQPFPWTLETIAALTGGTLQGEAKTEITGVASVEEAEAGDLVFAESPRYLVAALKSRATAVLTSPETLTGVENAQKPLVLVAEPRQAFVTVLEALAPKREVSPGVHPTAVLGKNVRLGTECHIGAHVTVGDEVTLGDRVVLLPGARIGVGCSIGDDTVLYPNVVLYAGVTVGKRCLLHAGCVVGADGFGYVPVGNTLRKVPQLGTVSVGDDVEIGANACVDRAKTGVTVIGSGTKIDNLVHVGHNVHIGASCILVAQAGIAGGVEIGNGVILAGQAGIKDHVTIGDGARVLAQGGVMGDVAAGETVSGYPARPHAAKMREYAAMAQLPEYIKRIRALEKELAELKAHLNNP
jgi:UDP-3-O-[3-hydroxymyristoyl] glucosamine N-acyltransferase